MMMLKRYRDIIITKLPNLPYESNEPEKKVDGTPTSKSIITVSSNRESKKSKHRERGRSKENERDRNKKI